MPSSFHSSLLIVLFIIFLFIWAFFFEFCFLVFVSFAFSVMCTAHCALCTLKHNNIQYYSCIFCNWNGYLWATVRSLHCLALLILYICEYVFFLDFHIDWVCWFWTMLKRYCFYWGFVYIFIAFKTVVCAVLILLLAYEIRQLNYVLFFKSSNQLTN